MKHLTLIALVLLAGCDNRDMVKVSNAEKWEVANKGIDKCNGDARVTTTVGPEGYIDNIRVQCNFKASCSPPKETP